MFPFYIKIENKKYFVITMIIIIIVFLMYSFATQSSRDAAVGLY